MTAVNAPRHLDWDLCWNARDLGGLPALGGSLREGALVRASSLHGLTERGWAAAWDHGVRTVIDVRTSWERERVPQAVPSGFDYVLAPLEDGLAEDLEFKSWTQSGWIGTPLYYSPFVRRWPERVASVFRVIGDAVPGGVIVHCSAGRDRTGMIVAMLLSLLGADFATISGDYALSDRRLLTPAARALGVENQWEQGDAVLEAAGTTLLGSLRAFIETTDVGDVLRRGGLDEACLAALRRRSLAPGPDGGVTRA